MNLSRLNLWRLLDHNERAWMRCMDRQLEADKRIADLEREVKELKHRLDAMTLQDWVIPGYPHIPNVPYIPPPVFPSPPNTGTPLTPFIKYWTSNNSKGKALSDD